MNLRNPMGEKGKSVKHVSEGGRVGRKEGMDAKQSRPKADQAVSSVSAAPALVDRINLLLKRRLRQQLVALVISSGLCLLACSLGVAHQRSRASDEQPEYVPWVCTGEVGVEWLLNGIRLPMLLHQPQNLASFISFQVHS
jgi:hypothetical protein